jgi:polysaccharide export outer membrane protein
MRGRLRLVGLAAVIAVATNGCGAHRDERLNYNPANFATPDALPVTDALVTYRMGPGDVINVSVFNVAALSGEQQVDAAGNITMPLIGAVPAAGKSTDELSKDLAVRLGEKYLQQPQVTVSMKTAVSKTVTIDGSVATPGLYAVVDKTTLLKSIAMAHGTAEGANPKKVVVFRQIQGQRTAAAFDLTTIRDGIDPDPAIYPNDVIVVDGKRISEAWRTVLQAVPLVGLFARF